MTGRRRLALAATIVASSLLLGATVFAPVVGGAQESPTGQPTDHVTDQASDRQLERGARVRGALQPLVEEGVITAEQADAVTRRLVAAFPGRPGHFVPRGVVRGGLEDAAGAIGIEPRTLVEALQAGQTIAEVAEANGVDPQLVIDAMVADFNARVDEALEQEKISEEQAAHLKEAAESRITNVVNGEVDFRLGFWAAPSA
ncbi:MAG: hypothetical protein ACT4OP_11315 [Actinomycetota bacterium]